MAAAGLGDGARATVAVRLSGFEAGPDQPGSFQARVLSRHYLGTVELLNLAVSGVETPIRARIRCGVVEPGARDIWLALRESDVLVFETETESA